MATSRDRSEQRRDETSGNQGEGKRGVGCPHREKTRDFAASGRLEPAAEDAAAKTTRADDASDSVLPKRAW